MNTWQIGNALGVNFNTVARDMKESARNLADEPRRDMASGPNGPDEPRRGQSIGTSTLIFQMENQTQQQITDKLNVNQASVSRDLNRNFSNDSPAATITNCMWCECTR